MKKTIDTIILSTLWIFSIYTLYVAVFNAGTIETSNYLGFGLLAGLTILKLLKVRGFKKVLAVFLLAGSFNLFQFTPSKVSIVFGFSPSGHDFSLPGMQPLCSALFLLFVIVCFPEIKRFFHTGADKESASFQKPDERLVKFYYQRLTTKPQRELADIITHEDKYQNEFVIAAQQLMAERQVEKSVPSPTEREQSATVPG